MPVNGALYFLCHTLKFEQFYFYKEVHLNQYLIELLDATAIDITHLKNQFLNAKELEYIDNAIRSEQDFKNNFYTNEYGDNLEVLLFFFNAHKQEIINIMHGNGEEDALRKLYTSSTISGNYDCFRFDLSKFTQTYTPRHKCLDLYRIGRNDECNDNLGCSWAKGIEGLKAYCAASSISSYDLESRPVFHIEIEDSEVLFEGKKVEHELVLKPQFNYKTIERLDCERRNEIFN